MKVLLVIDVQNDFVSGSLGSKEAQETLKNIEDLVNEKRSEGYCIIFTKDTHSESYLETPEGKKLPVPHCIRGTKGWELAINNLPSEAIFEKMTFGLKTIFSRIQERVYLLGEEIEGIELCGYCTDICVISNALILKASTLSIPISVHEIACAGTSQISHNEAISIMRKCQIDIIP